jgi:hypothetical protein
MHILPARANPRNKIHITTITEAAAAPSTGGRANV